MPARYSTLADWLAWQETLHPQPIELGLERVRRVHRRLGAGRPAPLVVTVAGTNGKGSSVALLDAILRAAGYRTGSYTSPHLIRYNERIHVAGEQAGDEAICAAFERVDAARGAESLTYFEFGTLAALDIFERASLDVALLEVGLGGRLDAVNIVDADVALVTRIGIDHIDWLGSDTEAIGREKAGVFRPGRPAVCADPTPPQSLRHQAQRLGSPWFALGQQFDFDCTGATWSWRGPAGEYAGLPRPALPGRHQLSNASGVLMALDRLAQRLPLSREAVVEGLRQVRLAGRFQRIGGAVEQVLDVAHNAQSAQALADALADKPVAGRTLAVLGMMADKDCAGFARALSAQVDAWYTAGLRVARAAAVEQLADCVARALPKTPVIASPDLAAARDAVCRAAREGDRILVCGSFYSVAEWLELADTRR